MRNLSNLLLIGVFFFAFNAQADIKLSNLGSPDPNMAKQVRGTEGNPITGTFGFKEGVPRDCPMCKARAAVNGNLSYKGKSAQALAEATAVTNTTKAVTK